MNNFKDMYNNLLALLGNILILIKDWWKVVKSTVPHVENEVLAGMLKVGAWGIGVAGLLTHIVLTWQAGNFVLLVLLTILFPFGIVHGVGLWFGLF